MSDQMDGAEPLGFQDRAQWRGVLKTPFRNLFYASVTSSLGDWVGVIAILALTEQILGPTRAAAFAVAGVIGARVLPTMLLGPVAGVFVDRWDRRRLLIVTDLGRAVVMALIPFASDVWALFLATLVVEVMSTLFIPAKDAVIPSLVDRDQLVQANQLNLMAAYGTFPLGGVLYAVTVGASVAVVGGQWQFLVDRPAAIPIWLNALSFVVSALFVMRIPDLGRGEQRSARTSDDDGPGAWEELKEGFRFIATHPLVRGLVTGVMSACLAAGAVVAVGQLFAVIVNAGDTGFGVLVAVVGSGMFAGLLLTGPLSRRMDKERLFAPGIGIAGLALVAAALMPRLDLASIPGFVMGMGAGAAFLSGYTILQERTSDDIRGRTFAAFNTGVRVALFASLFLAPLLVAFIGPEAPGLVPDSGSSIGQGPTAPATMPGAVAYAIGGIRITLILAGVVAMIGAIYTHRVIRQARTDHDVPDLGSARSVRPDGGLFVVFEGGDGAGKSTQARLLREALEQAGHEVVVTSEPGGSEIGRRLREVVLDPSLTRMSDRAEALLYLADRAQHVDEVIVPALQKGHVVVCDRYVDSSIVYQGVARGLGKHVVSELNRWATTSLVPDLVIVLDVDAVEGLRRRGTVADRLEGAGMDFHREVNQAFRDRVGTDPQQYLMIDAALPEDQIHVRVHDAVCARLPDVPT